MSVEIEHDRTSTHFADYCSHGIACDAQQASTLTSVPAGKTQTSSTACTQPHSSRTHGRLSGNYHAIVGVSSARFCLYIRYTTTYTPSTSETSGIRVQLNGPSHIPIFGTSQSSPLIAIFWMLGQMIWKTTPIPAGSTWKTTRGSPLGNG